MSARAAVLLCCLGAAMGCSAVVRFATGEQDGGAEDAGVPDAGPRDGGDACQGGMSCTPTAICHQGRQICTNGTASCDDTGTARADGTSCGPGLVCSGGDCVSCAAGGFCVSPGACHGGTLDCSGGTPICNETPSVVSNGTSCGTDRVCKDGSCNDCAQDAPCAPLAACHVGKLDCKTGSPLCVDSGPAPDGTACGGGSCAVGSCRPDVTVAGTVLLDTQVLTPGRTCADAVHYSVATLLATSVTLTSSPAADCLSVGDEVLLINLEGAPGKAVNTGNYELLKVASVTGASVGFATAKTRFYGAAVADDLEIGVGAGQQRVVLQRVPSYGRLSVPAGATLTTSAWNGQAGAVLALRAGALSVTGKISTTGLAYRSGSVYIDVSSCSVTAATSQGESITGPGVSSTTNNTGGPGGTPAVSGIAFQGHTYVPGSAGHATAGQVGNASTGRAPGLPGVAYGAADGSGLTFGSGNSGGFSCSYAPAYFIDGSPTGGGIIALLVGTGTLDVNVGGSIEAGALATTGAAGGDILLRADRVHLGTNLVAVGGTTRTNGGFSNKGADGHIAIYYRTEVTGTTTTASFKQQTNTP